MTEKKLPNKLKLIFAPGCFDNFEGTQEELDALVKEIEEGFIDGSFFEESTPIQLDEVGNLSDEELESLTKLFESMDGSSRNRNLH